MSVRESDPPPPPWDPPADAWRRHAESIDDVAILLLDPHGRVSSWSRGAERLKGYTAEEIIGHSFSIFYPDEAIAVGHPQRELEAAAAIGRYAEEGWRVRKDGSRFWAHVIITAIHTPGGDLEGFGKVTRDLTPVKQAEEQRARAFALLQTTAATDSLTGLPNRRAWEECLEHELSAAERSDQPLCIAVLDLDNFKQYNDAYGHREGDHFLRRSSVLWRAQLRGSDTLARLGGEEFAVCLPHCAVEEAVTVVDRIRDSTPPGPTCSAGLAQWDGKERADHLFGRADRLLYEAKERGRNRTASTPRNPPGPSLSAVS